MYSMQEIIDSVYDLGRRHGASQVQRNWDAAEREKRKAADMVVPAAFTPTLPVQPWQHYPLIDGQGKPIADTDIERKLDPVLQYLSSGYTVEFQTYNAVIMERNALYASFVLMKSHHDNRVGYLVDMEEENNRLTREYKEIRKANEDLARERDNLQVENNQLKAVAKREVDERRKLASKLRRKQGPGVRAKDKE